MGAAYVPMEVNDSYQDFEAVSFDYVEGVGTDEMGEFHYGCNLSIKNTGTGYIVGTADIRAPEESLYFDNYLSNLLVAPGTTSSLKCFSHYKDVKLEDLNIQLSAITDFKELDISKYPISYVADSKTAQTNRLHKYYSYYFTLSEDLQNDYPNNAMILQYKVNGVTYAQEQFWIGDQVAVITYDDANASDIQFEKILIVGKSANNSFNLPSNVLKGFAVVGIVIGAIGFASFLTLGIVLTILFYKKPWRKKTQGAINNKPRI